MYTRWEGKLSPVMRQRHPAGERLFVDYAGRTIDVIDPQTGEVRTVQVFVAVLGGGSGQNLVVRRPVSCERLSVDRRERQLW